MAYGTIKVDTITFTDGGVDKSVSVSGLVENPTFTGNVTATGTISGDILRGQTISGVTVTGTTANFTSGNFTNISGGTHTITSGVFALGTAANPSISFVSDPNSGLYSPGADQVAISTNGTGRLFVDSSGRVGVNPDNLSGQGSQRFTVGGSIATQGSVANGSNGEIRFIGRPDGSNYNWAGIRAISNVEVNQGVLAFFTSSSNVSAESSTERMRLDSSGRLGLGTSSPVSRLHVVQSLAGNDVSTGAALLMTTSTATNDRLNLNFSLTGNGDRARAGIGAVALDSSGGFNCGLAFYTRNQADGSTLAITDERMRIDSSGRVGVGTTSPSSKLSIATSANSPALDITDASTSDFIITPGVSSGVCRIGPATGAMALYTGNTERARIDSSGRLGLGTSSPSQILHVSNSTTYQGILINGNAAPSICFDDSTNTAIKWRVGLSGVNSSNFTISKAGNDDKLVIDSSGNVNIDSGTLYVDASNNRVGIGTTDIPSDTNLAVLGNFQTGFYRNVTSGNRGYSLNIGAKTSGGFADGGRITGVVESGDSTGYLTFSTRTGGVITEKAQIDSSGRLLVGTSTAGSVLTKTIELAGAGTGASQPAYQIYSYPGAFAQDTGYLQFYKSRGSSVGTNTIVASGDRLGVVRFYGANGTGYDIAADIYAEVDGTPGANDMPGRLVFSTTADGASSPTERARITNAGYFKASNTGAYQGDTGTYHEFRNSVNDQGLYIQNTNASFTNNCLLMRATRAAASDYRFAIFDSGDGADTEFNFRGDGNGYCDGSWNGGGADYAEYFEWSDGNPNEEDRRGISVVLDGDKIRPALAGEDPIGVISGNPSVVGDSAWNKWNGKYLRDEFGTYIQEDCEVEDEDGNTIIQQRRKLNPAYDPDVEYTSREERPEWDCVGLMGKLRIRKGQPTGSRWIKMRDISDSVEEWLVR
jgi:hypothetical protein